MVRNRTTRPGAVGITLQFGAARVPQGELMDEIADAVLRVAERYGLELNPDTGGFNGLDWTFDFSVPRAAPLIEEEWRMLRVLGKVRLYRPEGWNPVDHASIWEVWLFEWKLGTVTRGREGWSWTLDTLWGTAAGGEEGAAYRTREHCVAAIKGWLRKHLPSA